MKLDLFLEFASPPGARRSLAEVMEDGLAIVRALIERKVIGDFRAPNIMRFGFTPLTLSYEDVFNAVCKLDEVMKNEAWRDIDQSRYGDVT